MLIDDGKTYLLDLQSGRARQIGKSNRNSFAVDRRSQTVLLAPRVNESTEFTLFHLENGQLKPLSKGIVRLALQELQSMKSNEGPEFYFSGCDFVPMPPPSGELPFWVGLSIRPQEDGKFEISPVPGLSEISDTLLTDSIGFEGDAQGTFAYNASATPQSLTAAKESAKLPPLDPGRNNLFLIISGGKVRFAWPTASLLWYCGRVIGFSSDGKQLLAGLILRRDAAGAADPSFRLIDLSTGELATWLLGDPYDVLSVDGTLKRAIIQSQYGTPAPGTAANAPLQKPEVNPEVRKWRWRAELAAEGKPTLTVLQVDGGDLDFAATYIDGKFFVTDGKTLGSVDHADRVSDIPIDFGK